jgi:polysaccharide deacetylase 2 family uncharacterized protein YibQ
MDGTKLSPKGDVWVGDVLKENTPMSLPLLVLALPLAVAVAAAAALSLAVARARAAPEIIHRYTIHMPTISKSESCAG